MASRDPFPMASAEAKRMAASIAGNNNKPDWHSMSTKSAVAGPKHEASERAASEGLMGKPRKRGDDDDDNDDEEDEDEFLDRPLWESRKSKGVVRVLRLLERIYTRLYGDKLPPAEMLRVLTLATTLFFMIGGFWLLRSLKDPVLTALCGVGAIPKAKMLSVFVVLGVVTIYNRLLDSDIAKHKLFYVFGTFYSLLFLTIAVLLKHPTIGLPNEQQDPGRILGWLSYCGVESFGSVMVSLFWSFANSNISLETAKASYGVMVATAQVGSIIGPTIVNLYAETWGVANCYVVGACCTLLLQVTMVTYVYVYGTADLRAAAALVASGEPKPKTERAGVLEGLKLFWKYNYVKGIFAISCIFMIAGTIVNFTLTMLANDYFAEEHPCQPGDSCWSADGNHGMSQEGTEAFTKFMGFFGQAANSLSFLLSLFGTSAIIRYLGLRLTLLLFPSLLLAVVIVVRLNPTLYVAFAAMMFIKSCSYALNNPTKEILYQPTSPAVKYKAKSWIDIFGARSTKAIGSIVTNAFSDSAANVVANGTLVGMCVATFLIWNATYMGRKFDEYTESGYVVGADFNNDDPDKKYMEMAVDQNNAENTSCAVVDDDDKDVNNKTGPAEEGQEKTGIMARATMV